MDWEYRDCVEKRAMAWGWDLVLDLRSIYLCTWEVKRVFVLVFNLSNPQSTQETGSSSSRVGHLLLTICKLFHHGASVQILCFFPPPLTAGRSAFCCRCLLGSHKSAPPFFTLGSKKTSSRTARIQMGLAKFLFITPKNVSVWVWRFSQRWRPGIVS